MNLNEMKISQWIVMNLNKMKIESMDRNEGMWTNNTINGKIKGGSNRSV